MVELDRWISTARRCEAAEPFSQAFRDIDKPIDAMIESGAGRPMPSALRPPRRKPRKKLRAILSLGIVGLSCCQAAFGSGGSEASATYLSTMPSIQSAGSWVSSTWRVISDRFSPGFGT